MIAKAFMSVNDYQVSFIKKIDSVLKEKTSQNCNEPLFAAFDADGTLWQDDVGELFFDYQIKNCSLNLPEEPWHFYENLKSSGKYHEAYLWLAQINKGQTLAQVRNWAQDCFERNKQSFNFFGPQKVLIELLRSYGVEIYIVTASVKWGVEPFANYYNIDINHVLGVKTKVLDGLLSDIGEGYITCGEGKSQALLEHTKGIKPFLCAGNTLGDEALIALATHFPIAVTSYKLSHKFFKVEDKLQVKAHLHGWTCHQF